MKTRANTMLLAFFGSIGLSHAAITWTWDINGVIGYFVTDGDLVAGNAPAGTYNVTDMGVTDNGGLSILEGSMTGGIWNEGFQPGTGFVWDGAQATQYFRNADGAPTFTNGSNYYSSDSDRISFNTAINSVYDDVDGFILLTSSSTSSLAPAVPEPGSLMFSCLAGLVAVFTRRRSMA